MRQLSKSKILAYRQCPKRLWLEIHRPELRDDSGNEMAFAIGNRVGDVARKIYDPRNEGHFLAPHEIGWEESFTLTSECLAKGKGPLFEAYFRIPGALALADVMLRDGEGWRMVEVKSSASVKDYHHDDLAVQAYIARESGLPLTGVAIAHVDTSFVYNGGDHYKGLLVEVDMSGEVSCRAGEVESWVSGAQETAALPDEPQVEVGPHCSDPFECPFARHCWKHIEQPEYPLTSFYRMRASTREQLEAEGYRDVREVPEDRLGDTNAWIRRQTISGEAGFDREGAAAELSPHTGTARFLDFETIAFAVPIWKLTRPYQQLPFQFSCHVVEENGTQRHHEFLDLTGDDPRVLFAAALLEACANEGPVFVYNAKFENRIMRELAVNVPEAAPAIERLIARVVDLEPIARRNYYHPDQHGSWSLKAVLPTICPDLDYGALEGVHHGGEAQKAYLEAISKETAPDRRDEIHRQLLEYCKLDTLALVRMWERFRGL